MAFLRAGLDPLRVGAFSQNNRLHATGGIVVGFMAAEEADYLGKNFSDRSIFSSGLGDGLGRGLVGTISPRYARGVRPTETDRTHPGRDPCSLVLSGQTHLAIQSDFHLSPMERRA